MTEDRPTLLGEPRHVDHAATTPLEMGRHAENGPDSDDTGPAYPVDDPGPAIVERMEDRIGHTFQRIAGGTRHLRSRLAQLAAMDRDEGGTEAVETGEILVAARLVDAPLATELRFHRLHRHTVRLHPAIAAAFANELVDEDALVGIGIGTTLAPPTLFRSTGLIIEKHRDARHLAQFALDIVQFVAVVDRHPRWPCNRAGISVGIVGNECDALDTFGANLPRNRINRQPALMRLPAGHRNGVVIEDLVGYVRVRRESEADRQSARVIICAVSEILEEMRARGKWRLADPLRALPAHLREALGLPVHPERHVGTTDPGRGNGTLRHIGRRVVRAARAKMRCTPRHIGHAGQHRLELPQPLDPAIELLGMAHDLQNALPDGHSDLVGIERATDRE